MSYQDTLKKGVDRLGIPLTESQLSQLIDYVDLLVKWNQVYNLTRQKDPESIVLEHILDCLSIVPYITGEKIVDVGTGPGLPGIVLAIALPLKSFLLVDSQQKRTIFCQEAIRTLELNNVKVQNTRVLSCQEQNEVKFDHFVCRALGSFEMITDLAASYLASQGTLLAMKSLQAEQEWGAFESKGSGWGCKAILELKVPFLKKVRKLFVLQRV